ncbi:MAG: hypothetical protein M1828_004447 [Chrysothrix sp. TS-e1954]|nr:MAG: hypothetical protein M1828_004447 [Chrysothrix sp. TS-e1954]
MSVGDQIDSESRRLRIPQMLSKGIDDRHTTASLSFVDTHQTSMQTRYDDFEVEPDHTYFSPTPWSDPPPPSYQDALLDYPPIYPTANTTYIDVGSRVELDSKTSPSPSTAPSSPSPSYFELNLDLKPTIDWTRVDNVRTHGKKKNQPAKQSNDWFASDNEGDGNKAGEGADQNGDGATGGGGAGGAGGDGGGGDGGGGGGGDDDDWASGWGKKSKKKGKKGKKGGDDEEEEEKKKEEEEKLAAASDPWGENLNVVDAAGDANPDDEWGTATTGKKGKKGKKGKTADPIPPPPAPPPPASSKPADSFMNKFDDISLNDAVPKIDLNFGSSKTKGSNDFDLGSGGDWGSGWGTSSWGFGGLDSGKKSSTAKKDATESTGGLWGFGSSAAKKDKKDDKKEGKNAFDFDFGLDEDASAGKKEADDPWGGFTSISSKDKKGKKASTFSALDEIAPEPDTKKYEEQDDVGWGSFSTSKKDKKGKKGMAAEPMIPPPPPTVPALPIEADADDMWSSLGSKKDKKKGKGSKFEEPAVVVMPEPEPVAKEDDVWGSGAKKDKKKNKKLGKEPDPEPEPDLLKDTGGGGSIWDPIGGGSSKKDKKATAATTAFSALDDLSSPKEEKEADDDWMNWNGAASKTDKKKKKAGPDVPPVPPIPEPPEDDWPTSAWGSSKIDKKGKKAGKSEPEPPPTTATKGKRDSLVQPDKVDEAKTEVEEEWGTWGVTSATRSKKKDPKRGAPTEVKNGETPPVSVVQPDPSAVGTDTWGSSIWGTGKKDKKGKTANAVVPPPVPTPPQMGLTPGNSPPPEDEEEEDWSATTASKKKGKPDTSKKATPASTSKTSKATDAKVADAKDPKKKAKDVTDDLYDDFDFMGEEDSSKGGIKTKEDKLKDETPAKAAKGFWGSFGGSTKDSTKTTKEKAEKAKPEKEKALADEDDFAAIFAVDGKDSKKSDDLKKKSASATSTLGKKGIDAKATKADSKSKKSSSASPRDEDEDIDDLDALLNDGFEPNPISPVEEKKSSTAAKKSDPWSFWGASKVDKDKDKKEKEKREKEEKERVEREEQERIEQEEKDKKEKEKEAKSKKTGVTKGKEIGIDKSANHKNGKGKTGVAFDWDDPVPEDPIKPTKDTLPTTTSKYSKSKYGKDSTLAAEKAEILQEEKSSATTATKGKKGSLSTATDSSATVVPPAPPVIPAAGTKASSATTAPPSSKAGITRKPTAKSAVSKKELESSIDDASNSSPLIPGGFPDEDATPNAKPSKTGSKLGVDKNDKKGSKAVESEKDKKGKPSKAAMDIDDFLDMSPAPSPPAPEVPRKNSIPAKKSSSSKKVPEPVKPPTPPSEAELEKSSARKERPKVKRDSSGSIYGLPKEPETARKEKRAKDDISFPPSSAKKERPGLSRSSSARKASDKVSPPSSGADEPLERKKSNASTTRPSHPSRGMSFSSFFGGSSAPPSRRSSIKNPPSSSAAAKQSSSTSKTERRRSMDMSATGLPSPPPENDYDLPHPGQPHKVSAKAAKTLGLPGMKNAKPGKPKKKPDPYSLDDDDLLMADDLISPPPPSAPLPGLGRSKTSGATPKGDLKQPRRKSTAPFLDDLDDGSWPDTPSESAKPKERPGIKRSGSTSQKRNSDAGGLMSLFGSRRDGASAKKVLDDNDDSKRLRRESRRVPDLPPSTLTNPTRPKLARESSDGAPPDESSTQRAARRMQREREARRKVKNEEAKKVEDERAARRASRRAKEDAAAAKSKAEASDTGRKSSRRESRDAPPSATRTRAEKDNRRRSSATATANPDDAGLKEDKKARDERRARRASAWTGDPTPTPKSGRRGSSSANSGGDYFPNTASAPSSKSRKDPKTKEWLNHVTSSNPLPPPVEATILEPEPELRSGDRKKSSNGGGAGRKSAYRMDRERERQRDRSGTGSGDSRDGVEAAPKDAGTAASARRGSWFKRFGGL